MLILCIYSGEILEMPSAVKPAAQSVTVGDQLQGAPRESVMGSTEAMTFSSRGGSRSQAGLTSAGNEDMSCGMLGR